MDSPDLYQKYLDSALHFLSYRPRSEKEITDNLKKKKAPQTIIDQIISWLKEQRFINDSDFARWWIEQRTLYRPKGIRVIKMELKQKGVGQEIIDAVFQNNESEIMNQDEIARRIVEKKLPKYKSLEKREIYKKLGGHLARKGFDWETIKKSINKVMEDS